MASKASKIQNEEIVIDEKKAQEFQNYRKNVKAFDEEIRRLARMDKGNESRYYSSLDRY